MKKALAVLLLTASFLVAQQPQTQTAPIYPANAKWANGVAPGYAPTKGSGLTLNVSAGTCFDSSNAKVDYAGGTLAMTGSATNYVYLDNTCTLTISTTSYPTSGAIAQIATVTATTVITVIVDDRSFTKPAIPATQIQSDWTQANNLLPDYIKNKPTIPAAQIQSNWTQANNSLLDYIKNKPTLGNSAALNVGTGAGTVAAGNDSRITSAASTLYVQSRGQNLVTNGSGLLGTNYNFTMFTFDPINTYGGKGAFTTATFTFAGHNDELIPVDGGRLYWLSMWAKSIVHATGAHAYFGYNPFDIDGLVIQPFQYMRMPGTDTTLAADLHPGDTVIHLSSAANWITTTSNIYQRQMVVWNWVNAQGYSYPPYTYSRHATWNWSGNTTYQTSGLWANGGISGNDITLTQPWPVSFGTIAAGTAVSNGSLGNSSKYVGATNVDIPNAWTNYAGYAGEWDTLGSNTDAKFPYGTAYIQLIFYLNRDVAGNTTTISDIWFGEYPAGGQAPPVSKTIVGTNANRQLVDASTATLSNNTSGNAATATAAHAVGTECASGQAARGVDASWNARDCFSVPVVLFSTAQQVTMTSGTGTISGTATNLVVPGSNRHYMFTVALAGVSAGSGGACTQGTAGAQLSYTDCDGSVAVTGSNNVPVMAATSAVASDGVTVVGSLSGSTVARGVPVFFCAKSGAQVSYLVNQSVGSDCTTVPIIKVRPVLLDMGY